MRPGSTLAFVAMALASPSVAAPTGPLPDQVARAYIGPHRLVEVEGNRRLNLLCMGEGGSTVLFDSGGSDWSATWALVQPVVAKMSRACTYDRAGLGYSDPASGPRTPVAIVEDLHALIRAANLPRPLVLVGHSLGGFNVKLYAALYPGDVAGLVLIDPAEERPWDRTRASIQKSFGPILAARAELLDLSFATQLVKHFEQCGTSAASSDLDPSSATYKQCTDPPRTVLGPMLVAERQRLQVSNAYQAAQASEIVNSLYGDLRADPIYARLFKTGMFGNRPVVVLSHGIYDKDDPLDALSFKQWLALHRQTARLSTRRVQRTIPGTHHNIQLEAPEAIVDAIATVLATRKR